MITSIRLDEHQEKYIQKSNQSKSEFIRRAVDHYILYLENPYKNELILELEKWINKQTYDKSHTKVLQNNTNVLQYNTDVGYCNTNVLQDNTNVSYCNTEKDTKKKNTEITNILNGEIPTIARLLRNPENLDSIPEFTLKKLAKSYDLSKSVIQEWVTDNKDWLKEQ